MPILNCKQVEEACTRRNSKQSRVLNSHTFLSFDITLFRSIIVICGTNNFLQNIIPHSYWMWGIFHKIMTIPYNIVMNLNNVMHKLTGLLTANAKSWLSHIQESFHHQRPRNVCIPPIQWSRRTDNLVTDEPVEFEEWPVEVHQDFRRITKHFRGIYEICLKLI
jgi:hypothetical protein